MPRREDLKKIMIIGAGPIVIGQACEFDYSGTQAAKALKEEGYEVVLVNSNPATIMTDPEMADATYVEPITPEVIAKIIQQERPDALLPTLGGQTALNMAVALHEQGILDKYHVELIGATMSAIKKAEDRKLFKEAMIRIGLKVPRSALVHNRREAVRAIKQVGFPAIIRPAFTLGGMGGNIATNPAEYEEYVAWGLECSPVSQILVEQSVLGWKEFELEVMRDKQDNVVIVCSIENFDPMGVHTGDSITVAPAQTLTDKEYQIMRNAAIAIMREIGVDTGGSNVQFAVNPKNGEMIVIEMNPRVSRSSALASKATGFPIAKFATKLAVGYTLDEIKNDITKTTPASFEPTIDYVVTKFPRFTFEKFPLADDRLTTQMKSVGEAMAIGRTFKESLQKALRSMEIGSFGFEEINLSHPFVKKRRMEIREHLVIPKADRIWWIAQALREGFSIQEVHRYSKIDPWFLQHIAEVVALESPIRRGLSGNPRVRRDPKRLSLLVRAKQMGYSDCRLAVLTGRTEASVNQERQSYGLKPVFKRVDTCGAEFVSHTPYLYSTYEQECEAEPTNKQKVVILGGGPNRIGQGIEFDYCCVHAVQGLRDQGYETIMINCNPETVSTDYDTADRLYFEPLTFEDVTRILEVEKPIGVVVQFGGQTPLKLARALEVWGASILGTSPDSIDEAEDRERFAKLVQRLGLKQPANGIAKSFDDAITIARGIGYPVLVRPSYVLGGRAMEIVYDEGYLKKYLETAVRASEDRPVLVDQYLDAATEVDVDALGDGEQVVVAGIMEHIEEAGVHSGDSACCLPPHSLSGVVISEIERQTVLLGRALKVKGLMNIQFAVKDGAVYLIEVNPRASRTVPFVSKAIGIPLAKLAVKVMMGTTLRELGITHRVVPPYKSVKEAVFPFAKFPGVDTLLGPEMKSTGEVMGMDPEFGMAFAKAQLAAGTNLPREGEVFLSVRDRDKEQLFPIAKQLVDQGFQLVATRGTRDFLNAHGLRVRLVNKVYEGSPHIVDEMKVGKIAMVVNTHEGRKTALDSYSLRRTALMESIPYFTTIAAASAAVRGIQHLAQSQLHVLSLQGYQTKWRAAI